MSTVLPPNLAVQQANDAVPGTVPRIPGALKILRANANGSALEYVDPSTAGVAGQNAFTTLAAGFTMPAIGSSANATVGSTAWLATSQPVFLATGGQLSVAAVVDGTTVSLTNTGATGNASPGTVIANGSKLTPAGAKGADGAPGTGRNPVRAVQTGALPAFSYNATTKVLTFTANGELDASVFDGVVPKLADVNHDVLITSIGVANTVNGIYTKIQDGDGTHQSIWQRRADLDASADFANGVQIDVLDGATAGANNKGSRWGLATLTAVTLDTTATTWARLGTSGAIYIYANQSPYNLFNDPLHQHDQQPALKQLAWDLAQIYAVLGIPAYAIIGAGDYVVEHMVPFRKGTGLIGLSPENTRFLTSGRNGGWMFAAGHDGTRPPVLLGHVVDTTSANNKPWQPYDAGQLDSWINLTTDLASNPHHCFLWTDRTSDAAHETPIAQFEFACNFECVSLGTGTQHVASCRGAKTSKDGVETCFRITLASDGSMQGVLRLHDESTGSYSAATVTNGGGGTSVITGDGTIKPTADGTIVLYIVNGGTVGTPGITYLYSIDGGLTFNATPANALALGTATSISIGYPDSPFVTAKLNLSAGTVVTGASYTLTCSGVETSYTLNLPAATVAAGNQYECGLQYDGSTIRFYCAQFNATITVGITSNITTTSGHGGVLQRSYEELVVGNSMNFGAEGSDTRPAQLAYGAIRILQAPDLSAIIVSVPPTPCRTAIPGIASIHASNQLCYLPFGFDGIYFHNDSQLKEIDGTVYGWTAARGQAADGWASVYMRRANPDQPKNNRFEGFTIVGLSSGIIEPSTVNAVYRDLWFQCAGDQLRVVGPNQFSRHESLRFTGGRKQLTIVGGQGATLHGYCYHESGLIQCLTFGSGVDQNGAWFLNPGADTRHCVLLDCAADGDTHMRNVLIDGEELAGYPRPRELMRVYARHNRIVSIAGVVNGSYNLPIAWLGETDGTLDLASRPMAATSKRSCSISFEGSASAPLAINAASTSVDTSNPAKQVPWTNVNGKSYMLGRGAPPAGVNLATGNETLVLSDGPTRRMITGTTAGNSDKTLSVTGVREGDVWEFPIESQGNQVRFLNGGAAGGTLVTIAASTAARTYRFQALGGHLGLNWVQRS